MTTPNTSAAPPRAEPPPAPRQKLNPWWVASRVRDAAACAFLVLALVAVITGALAYVLPYMAADVVVCVQTDYTAHEPCTQAALVVFMACLVLAVTLLWAVGQVARAIERNGKEKYVSPRRRP